MGRVVNLLAVAAAVSVVGCNGSKSPSQNALPVLGAFRVTTARVVERSIPSAISLTGTITADVRADLTANASGRIARTFVERGQRVEQGALIAQLDIRSAAAGAAEAHAQEEGASTQFEAAQAECARQDALAARGAITQQEHERQAAACKEKLAALAASRARLAGARLTLENGTIRAPFAGTVTERFVTVGDYVQASSRVVTLVVSNPLRLKLTVPEHRTSEVKQGMLVTFSPTSMPDRTFSGRVRYLSGEIRTTTRDMVVEAVVPNPEGALLPGMFVNATLQVGERPVPVVPRSAVFTTGQDASVFVVKNGQLVLRTVLVGAQMNDVMAIDEGAAVGEDVVTDPTPDMFDGAPVE